MMEQARERQGRRSESTGSGCDTEAVELDDSNLAQPIHGVQREEHAFDVKEF